MEGEYLMLARILIKVGWNPREAYWCCVRLCETVLQRVGSRVLKCALQSFCFACMCVSCVCWVRVWYALLTIWKCTSQYWHSNWASGMLAKRGRIGLGSDPEQLAPEISELFIFFPPGPVPGHSAVSCLIFHAQFYGHKPPGHLTA